MKKTIVYILSTNYSGSHYLSLTLGSHSKFGHLGEIKNLVKAPSDKRDGYRESSRYCYLCGGVEECKIFSGLHRIDDSKLYETIFNRFGAEIQGLVDNSKKVKWADRFVNQGQFDIKFVHLIRDPRAFVHKSLLRHKGEKDRRRELIKLFRDKPIDALRAFNKNLTVLYAYKWLRQNREISQFLSNSSRPWKVVTYRDFALEPDAVLRDIMEWAGFEYEPGQLEYWNFQHHGSQKIRYSTDSEEVKKRFIDLKWQQGLSEADKSDIITNRYVLDYWKSQGGVILDDGLSLK